jgi:hypothetical protein
MDAGYMEFVRPKKSLWISLLLAALGCASMTASAAEQSGPRTIENMGCDNVDTICYVYLSGASVGGSLGCASNYVEWDLNDPNGKTSYASLMAAFLAGKQVNIYMAACLPARPTFPTIYYFNIYN